MRITPLDIRKQPFRKKLKGFDPDEVNSFLELVADEFESLNRQNDELASQLKQCSQQLDGYRRIEKTLNETLLTAQRATDEARLNAQKEAELIIKDAQIRADRYEHEARRRVHTLESELLSLKNQRESFLTRFKSMLRDQTALLEIMSDKTSAEKAGSKPQAGYVNANGEDDGAYMDDSPSQPNVSRFMLDEGDSGPAR